MVKPRAAGRALTNIPAHLPRLIGRDHEAADVERRLLGAERGLLTLTGAGGCGKTSLALHVADGLEDRFPDGVWRVQLASVAGASSVAAAIAAPFGVQEGPERPLADPLALSFQSRALLLVLDN